MSLLWSIRLVRLRQWARASLTTPQKCLQQQRSKRIVSLVLPTRVAIAKISEWRAPMTRDQSSLNLFVTTLASLRVQPQPLRRCEAVVIKSSSEVLYSSLSRLFIHTRAGRLATSSIFRQYRLWMMMVSVTSTIYSFATHRVGASSMLNVDLKEQKNKSKLMVRHKKIGGSMLW